MFKPSDHIDWLVDESFVLFIAAFVPPTTHEVLELLTFLLALAHIPQPSQSIRIRHFAENENEFSLFLTI